MRFLFAAVVTYTLEALHEQLGEIIHPVPGELPQELAWAFNSEVPIPETVLSELQDVDLDYPSFGDLENIREWVNDKVQSSLTNTANFLESKYTVIFDELLSNVDTYGYVKLSDGTSFDEAMKDLTEKLEKALNEKE